MTYSDKHPDDPAGQPPSDSAGHKPGRLFSARTIIVTVLFGTIAGIFAGLFGVGGGLILVPGLAWLGMPHRQAVANSLAAIVPISISGAITYTLDGNMNWPTAICMAAGMVVGAQIGSWLLEKLSNTFLNWAFTVFLLVLICQQFLILPERNAVIHFTPVLGVFIVVTGIIIGTLAGILGVGGGGLLVPSLVMFFGAGDLLARGISVFAMFPGAVSGTISNAKRHMVDVPFALLLGLVAAATTPVGKTIATAASPQLNQYLFAAFLAFLLIRSTWTSVRNRRPNPQS